MNQEITQSASNMNIIKYDITDAAIATLKYNYADLKIIPDDKKSYNMVRTARLEVKAYRVAIEKTRKELKEEALRYGRKVDTEAKRLTTLLIEIEKPLTIAQESEDERIEEAKKEVERKEAMRIAKIRTKINSFSKFIPTDPMPSENLALMIKALQKQELSQIVFEEFIEDAQTEKDKAIATLKQLLQSRLKWEEEDRQRQEELKQLLEAKVEAARLEAEAQRRQEEDRAKIEADRRIIAEERAKLEAEKKAEKERLEQVERDRVEVLAKLRRSRTEALLKIGYGADALTGNDYDLENISQYDYEIIYVEQKKVYDQQQAEITKAEEIEKIRQEALRPDEVSMKKVFLGGTCTSDWRNDLIPMLKIDYFNPIVEDWTPADQIEEIRQRKECDYCLYVLTPKMNGFYSIAEAIDDSNKRPEKTIFCALLRDGGDLFNYHQSKSLGAICKMIEGNGGRIADSLEDCATILNA